MILARFLSDRSGLILFFLNIRKTITFRVSLKKFKIFFFFQRIEMNDIRNIISYGPWNWNFIHRDNRRSLEKWF